MADISNDQLEEIIEVCKKVQQCLPAAGQVELEKEFAEVVEFLEGLQPKHKTREERKEERKEEHKPRRR